MADTTRKRSSSQEDNAISKKRKDTKRQQIANEPPVIVAVEHYRGRKNFYIHAHLLRHASEVFSSKLSENSSQTDIKPLIVRDVTFGTFEAFSGWLYSRMAGQVFINVGQSEEEDEEQQHSDNESAWYAELKGQDLVYARLVDLYQFATKFGIEDLQRDVMLKVQRLTTSGPWDQTVPCPMVVKHATEVLKLDSPLVKWFTLWYAHIPTDGGIRAFGPDYLACLPSRFLAESLHLAVRGKTEEDDYSPYLDEDWCQFHEHATIEEVESCEAGREDDADIRARIERIEASKGLKKQKKKAR